MSIHQLTRKQTHYSLIQKLWYCRHWLSLSPRPRTCRNSATWNSEKPIYTSSSNTSIAKEICTVKYNVLGIAIAWPTTQTTRKPDLENTGFIKVYIWSAEIMPSNKSSVYVGACLFLQETTRKHKKSQDFPTKMTQKSSKLVMERKQLDLCTN